MYHSSVVMISANMQSSPIKWTGLKFKFTTGTFKVVSISENVAKITFSVL